MPIGTKVSSCFPVRDLKTAGTKASISSSLNSIQRNTVVSVCMELWGGGKAWIRKDQLWDTVIWDKQYQGTIIYQRYTLVIFRGIIFHLCYLLLLLLCTYYLL